MSEKVAVLRLSEAIRIGSTMTPTQAFWHLYDPWIGGTCALGAAAEAVGILDKKHNDYLAPPPLAWRPVAVARASCPACGEIQDEAQCVIKHLNNEHRWTRERIADWVATVEAQMPAEQVEASQ